MTMNDDAKPEPVDFDRKQIDDDYANVDLDFEGYGAHMAKEELDYRVRALTLELEIAFLRGSSNMNEAVQALRKYYYEREITYSVLAGYGTFKRAP
jgi:hypothetical protein